jgi:glycosyltransferase involved in cell wall biosynthesis
VLSKPEITFIVPYNYKYESINTWKLFNYFSSKFKIEFIQKIFKFFEFFLSFFLIYLKLIFSFNSKKTVIISLYQPFVSFYYFFKILKLSNFKLVVIIHDLVPFPSTYPKFVLCDQDKLLGLADSFVAHNVHSKNELIKLNKPVYLFRFPLLRENSFEKRSNFFSNNSELKFLLIGHLRYEKGVDILIEAWKEYVKIFPYSELIIAGSLVPGFNLDVQGIPSIKVISKYLDDNDYSNLISSCDYGILPYRFGTNSGIFSSFFSMGKPVISSNIDLFTDSFFSHEELIFDINAGFLGLFDKLCFVSKDSETNCLKFSSFVQSRITLYENSFCEELNYFYEKLSDN